MSNSLQSPADRYMKQGIQAHASFKFNFQKAKEAALDAGFYFCACRDSHKGDFEEFLGCYSKEIHRATVYRYIGFVEEVIEWARKEFPKITKLDELIVKAREMVLQSPRGYIALCRELKLMRKFGEYDEVKYRTQKLKSSNAQIEFDFSAAASSLDVLSQIGSANFVFKLPDGKAEKDAVKELLAKVETVQASLKEKLSKLEATEI